MPEGDSVLRTARMLTSGLAGQQIRASDFRVPRLATVDLAGWQVGMTSAYGKHLFTQVCDQDGRDRWVHSHRRMDGKWFVTSPHQWPPVQAWRIRVLLTTDQARAAGVDLPVVELLSSTGRQQVLARLGPNVIDEDCDFESIPSQLALRGGSIAAALLDQRVVAGLGTIWVSEGLFAAGIAPLSPAASVPDPVSVLSRTGQMMRAAVETARPRWSVYDRRGRACRRCGGSVARVLVSDERRQVFWCPGCQRG